MLNSIVILILLMWVPITLLLYCLLPARRAMLVSLFAGWLFLPVASIHIVGFPDIGKSAIIVLSNLVGLVLFDFARLLTFRFKWYDCFAIGFGGVAVITSLLNELGFYDGLSASTGNTLRWVLPYFLGRIYLNDRAGFREFAVAVGIAALVYVPFVLFEARMSPHLHKWVYGYATQPFRLNIRMGGYRPVVFMYHGLMTALFMAGGLLAAYCLWANRSIARLAAMPAGWCVIILASVTILMRSAGAIILVAILIGCVFLARRLRLRYMLIGALLVAPSYMVLRSTGLVEGDGLLAAVGTFSKARAGSLQVRLENERVLIDHAMKRPWFGWGRWGRHHVETGGRRETITDGWWVIAIGQMGIVGLTFWTAMMLVPSLLIVRRSEGPFWTTPAAGPVLLIMMLPTLFVLDSLFNAMPNPIFLVAAGGTGSAVMIMREARGQLAAIGVRSVRRIPAPTRSSG